MYKARSFGALTFVLAILVILGVFSGLTAAYGAVIGNDYGTFNTFYQKNIGVWGWIGIGIGVAIGVFITIYTFGSGTPAWCATVGTWIGGTLGLSGAAATNAGLALLGGGSLAAGGWGMAGGVALLTAAATFSGELLVGYTIEKAVTIYSDAQFVKECRGMLHLPLPVNTSGGKAYCAAQRYIEKNYDKEKHITQGENPQVLRDAIAKMYALTEKETDARNRVKDETMLALLHWLSGDPGQAIERAVSAIEISKKWNEKEKWFYNYAITPTMAQFILAVCRLETRNPDRRGEAFEYSVLAEPNNKLVPLLYGIYLDRFMELHRDDKVDGETLKAVIKIADDPKVTQPAPAVSVILASRILGGIKRYQQDILVISENEDEAIRQKAGIKKLLNKRLDRYNELVAVGMNDVVPVLAKHDKYIPEDVRKLEDFPYKAAEYIALLGMYKEGSDDLKRKIAAYKDGGRWGSGGEQNDVDDTLMTIIVAVFLVGIFFLVFRGKKK